MLKTVAAILIDGYAPFEFGVVCEVFGIDRTEDGVPPFDFRVCGEVAGGRVRANVGFETITPLDLSALRGADLITIPAYTIRDSYPPAVIEALRAAHADGAILLSVCSAAFLLAETGLLDGRRCTTHWIHAQALADRFPHLAVDPNVLFVDEGDIITSAGTAAGIDACLHLVRRELGSKAATAIARRMVVPPQREGGQRQFVAQPVPDHAGTSLSPVLSWLVENLADDHSVATLAARANMSERTFARRFVTETGTTPLQWLSTQRVSHARTLLEETTSSVDDVATQCGFGTAALLRHHFQKAVGVSPMEYRRSFAAT